MQGIGSRASSVHILGLFSIIFIHVYWYIQKISGEQSQDLWSSGFYYLSCVPFLNYAILKRKSCVQYISKGILIRDSIFSRLTGAEI